MSYHNNQKYYNYSKQNNGYQSNQGYKNKRNYNANKNTQNRNKYFKPRPEFDVVNQVQSQSGIGKNLVLFCRDGENSQSILHIAANKMASTMKIDCSSLCSGDLQNCLLKTYQLKIGETVIVQGFYESLVEAKKHLSDLALTELQKVCFTIIKKTDPRDLPKVDIPSAAKNRVRVSGIGAKLMEKMGWTGKGLGSQEQGRTDIVKPYFQINRQGFGSKNITEQVRDVLENYSASQDYNSIAFSPDFTKAERAAIHIIARKLNLRTRSYGKNEERFLIVENRIRSWDLIYLLLEAGGENDQYKLVIPTNFSI